MARDICYACVELDQFQRDEREAKGAEELSAREFFNGCLWLEEHISDEAVENEDVERAWRDVKDHDEAEGWTKEDAQEIMRNCINAGKHIEEDEGEDFRPRRPE